MTIEDNIAWPELLNNPIVTAQHGNDGSQIATTTESLQQVAHQFAQVLNERAQLLANSAQFDTALRDAAAIRAILPGAGLGYLCMGDVYCQQGRYAVAISIYDQGLFDVPESDPYYQQLQQHHIAAATNNKKRVDFISQLPLDIVMTNIIPRIEQPAYLDSNELYGPLHVSRSWQQRILQQSKGLKFRLYKQVHDLKKGHTQLIRFAPYVQSLQITLLYDTRLNDLFSRAHFSNLKKLDILFPYCTASHLPLIHALQLIANSLTHLTISQCPGLELRDILEACPNLVYLKTRWVDAIMPLSSRYPNLQQLDIHDQREEAHTHEQMIDILSQLPSLRILKISPMPTTTILPILHKHCPYLQAISLECTSPDFGMTTANDGKGITAAYLGGEDFYYQQDDLIEFLYEHRNSLEILDFRGTLEVNNALWEISDDGRVQRNGSHSPSEHLENDLSSPLSFTQLIDFRFTDIFASNDVPLILWTVMNAPNLNAVSIGNLHFQPAVTSALINLEHLQKVQIEENYMEDMDEILMDDNDHGIDEFFEHHVALEDRSTLEHVVFRWDFVNESEHTWVHLLPELKCLKILEFCGKSRHATCVIADDCLPIIESIPEDCSSLEKLIINGKCRFG